MFVTLNQVLIFVRVSVCKLTLYLRADDLMLVPSLLGILFIRRHNVHHSRQSQCNTTNHSRNQFTICQIECKGEGSGSITGDRSWDGTSDRTLGIGRVGDISTFSARAAKVSSHDVTQITHLGHF
jgi:hypothetical protein